MTTKPQKVENIVEITSPESRDREEAQENIKPVLEDFDNVIENEDFNIITKEKPKKRRNLKKNS